MSIERRWCRVFGHKFVVEKEGWLLAQNPPTFIGGDFVQRVVIEKRCKRCDDRIVDLTARQRIKRFYAVREEEKANHA